MLNRYLDTEAQLSHDSPLFCRGSKTKYGYKARARGLSYTRLRELVIEAFTGIVPDISRIQTHSLTASFNNTRTLNFKAQPTNAFFATINQMFGGSSQVPTMLSELCSTPHAKHLKMLSTVRRQVKMEAFGKAEVIHMRDICKWQLFWVSAFSIVLVSIVENGGVDMKCLMSFQQRIISKMY